MPVTFTLDLAIGLTQVLEDGTHTYLYGLGRVAQFDGADAEYFLADGLGSVRQLVDDSGAVTLARSYEPYGEVLRTAGEGVTRYGFTAEWTTSAGVELIYLRARWFAPAQGRFLTRDTWPGQLLNPISLHRWTYANDNPVMFVDPSGRISEGAEDHYASRVLVDLLTTYNVRIHKDWGYDRTPYECEWFAGNWELDELWSVYSAVRDTSRAMGGPGKFKAVFGRVSVTRWSIGQVMIAGQPRNVGSFAPPGLASAIGDVVLTDNAFPQDPDGAKWVVVHELAHVWDHRTGHRLSQGLMKALGTSHCASAGCDWFPLARQYDYLTDSIVAPEAAPGTSIGCSASDISNRVSGCSVPYASTYGGTGSWATGPGWEDWAEAFASYVYPGFYPSQQPPRVGLVRGGVRETYIRQQIAMLP